MALIEWKPKYSVGIEQLDRAHQTLFELLNELHGAVRKGQGQRMMEEVFETLFEYTKQHFAAEEAVMKFYDYPGTQVHVEQHAKLSAELRSFQDNYRAGKNHFTIDVVNFLIRWLTEHVMNADQGYANYFATQHAPVAHVDLNTQPDASNFGL